MVAAAVLIAAACGSDSGESSVSSSDNSLANGLPAYGEIPTGETLKMKMGSIMPQSGALSATGADTERGVKFAVDEINAADKRLQIDLTITDSGTDPSIASTAADRLLNSKVSVMIGPVSSGIALSIIDKVTSAGVVMVSPTNTSPRFTDYDDRGYYFRTSPSSTFEAAVAADWLLEDGAQRIAIVHRSDDYARLLGRDTAEELLAAGADVPLVLEYDQVTPSFGAEVEKVKEANPDGIYLLGFEEAFPLILHLIEIGLNPPDVVFYLGGGLATPAIPGEISPGNPGVLEGFRAVAVASPSSESLRNFESDIKAAYPQVRDFSFTARAYDATIISALAALAAGSTDSREISLNINRITRNDGAGDVKCGSFGQCADLILDGKEIDYDGPSGPLDFADVGEPSIGTYERYEFDSSGERITLDSQSSGTPHVSSQ